MSCVPTPRHSQIDHLTGNAIAVLGSLGEQRSSLKGVQRKVLDMASTLGVSNSVIRTIESRQFWDKMLNTNLKGTFWGCKTAAEYLSPGGSIINVSSLAGKRGSANNSVYCASKFGVNGITQALAKELGPKGIRVNAVCPVYVETSGLLEALENPDAPSRGQETDAYLQEFAKANAALQRLPHGSEVADLCLYLASPAASAITSQCINVDCGVLPQ